MNKRRWIITTSSILLALLLISGYMAIAAEYGSSSDPLVSASYITDVLAPQTIKEVNAVIDQKTTQFQTQLNQTLGSIPPRSIPPFRTSRPRTRIWPITRISSPPWRRRSWPG